ncbi:LLM class flavin-dependent oxidoreductase [Serratia nevei]|uniref:LLM class flavin-dependent oxidoreductase n=1 Tax=Serratia nevei TaxID=2703794 RepID=UPI003FA7B95D
MARQFLSLDHLSSGRVGWNAVTTYNPASAGNFGSLALPDSSERYARAEEFIDVAKDNLLRRLFKTYNKIH